MSILILLNGMICMCLLCPSDIKCSSNLVFPYFLYVWMMYSLMKVGHWNSHHYYFSLAFFPLHLYNVDGFFRVQTTEPFYKYLCFFNLLPTFPFFTLISFLSTFILIFFFSVLYFNIIITIIIMWWRQSLETQEQLRIRSGRKAEKEKKKDEVIGERRTKLWQYFTFKHFFQLNTQNS